MTLGNVDLRSRGAPGLETRCAARAGQPSKREAQKELTRIFQQVDEQRTSNSTVFLGRALGEWLSTAEFEGATRKSYIRILCAEARVRAGQLVAVKANFWRIA